MHVPVRPRAEKRTKSSWPPLMKRWTACLLLRAEAGRDAADTQLCLLRFQDVGLPRGAVPTQRVDLAKPEREHRQRRAARGREASRGACAARGMPLSAHGPSDQPHDLEALDGGDGQGLCLCGLLAAGQRLIFRPGRSHVAHGCAMFTSPPVTTTTHNPPPTPQS